MRGKCMKKVCVIGLGYIGLPTALVAAQHGFNVIGFDTDKARVENINNGNPVIEEPEIQEKLHQILNTKQFIATNEIIPADYFIIAVPTPFQAGYKADLSYVWQAAESIATVLTIGNVVILESTVPVGTSKKLAALLERITDLKHGADFFVAHCPERVLPGNIFHELIYNDRIIGGIDEQSVEYAKNFYKAFVKGALYLTNVTTAEMIKLVENSSRDVAIAFANQVAAMAYKEGLDPFEVIELANKHPRVNILNPSSGVGGHCIAVDPWFLIETYPEQTELLKIARTINDTKPKQVLQATSYCINEFKKEFPQKRCTILVLGLTYKPDIDDLRESPALHIAQELIHAQEADILICEPYISQEKIVTLFGQESVTLRQGIAKADIILCLVKHKQFGQVDTIEISHKKVLDFCGLFYTKRAYSDKQEQFFWPASTVAIKPIIDFAQGDV
jgi:UDP-N-acetyl-D-mannosaminuronic acid dehydrogenase